jgi:hypothetical protein
MKNQTIFIEPKYMVKLFNIISTDLWVVEAWEKVEGSMIGCGFSTITFVDGQLWGRIGTNPNKAVFDHLPAWSKERIDAAWAAFNRVYQDAYELIYGAMPWLNDIEGREESMGEVRFNHKEG